MKNTQTFPLVMLPTEKASKLIFDDSSESLKILNDPKIVLWGFRHLYVLSDDNLKIGDTAYIRNGLMQFEHISSIKNKEEIEVLYTLDAKKIIATTDKSLGLPLIHDSFLPPFIRLFNENKQITEINLEIDEYCIKTRKDNTVIVHQSKVYSKDEMFHEVINFAKWYSGMEQQKVVNAYNRWMVETNESITLS